MVGLIILAIALTALYLNRRLAAREILVGWLDRQGIDADVEVESLELNGFVGKITIGDPDNPQVRVDRVEVDYALGMPWSKAGLGVTPSRIRLIRPVARASLKGGKLSLGALDPLIEDFTSRPPKPDSRAPLVIIEKGRADVQTDYGPVQILADARIDNSRLMSLKAQMPRASLKSGDLSAEALSLEADLVTHGAQTTLKLTGQAERLAQGNLSATAARLNLNGVLPYPDAKTRQSNGPLNLTADFAAQTFAQGATTAQGVTGQIDLKSELKGWLNTFTLAGQTQLNLQADRLSSGQTRATNLNLTSTSGTLAVSRDADRPVRWQLKGPAEVNLSSLASGETRMGATRLTSSSLTLGGLGQALEAQGPLKLTSDRIQSGDLDLRSAHGLMQVDMVSDGALRLNLSGDLSVDRGAYNGLGPVEADDAPELAALKRSLANFTLTAPSVRLRGSNAGLELNLLDAVHLTPSQGGKVSLEAAKTPLFTLHHRGTPTGAARLVSQAGGGLPEATIDISRWQAVRGGIEAQLSGKASLDFGPARGIELSASGLLSATGGTTQFVANDCLPVRIKQIELGENDLSAVSGQVCPSGKPLISLSQGRTLVSARLSEVEATAPSVNVQMGQGRGLLEIDSRAGRLDLTTGVEQLALSDLSTPARFLPLDARGQIGLKNDQWLGTFDIARKGMDLGQITLKHESRTGQGQLDIQTPMLAFSEHNLQPADISPMAGNFIQSPAVGSAQFEGQFRWQEGASDSHGRITIPNLSFTSPAGKVSGLRGTIDLTSLAPLATDDRQRLWIDSLETVVPLTDLDVNFSLQDQWLKLAGGTINAAGGRISIEPFDVPLNNSTPWDGVIVVHQIQLNDLLKSANLEDKAFLDAVVSGRLPFRFIPGEGWKIIGGQLGSVKPGRLSILPEVFDELGAGGGAVPSGDLPPNTMQDLAYQAMQDLAISDLTADVNSLENGRLGVRFRINGRHDPPQREQLRLTFMELIRRDFLSKKLNLPSDTPIDLTLDTTWNANQIASDVMEYVRRGEKP